MRMENYAGAILIAYRLYCEFIGNVDFNTFEEAISKRYSEVSFAVDVGIRDRRKMEGEGE